MTSLVVLTMWDLFFPPKCCSLTFTMHKGNPCNGKPIVPHLGNTSIWKVHRVSILQSDAKWSSHSKPQGPSGMLCMFHTNNERWSTRNLCLSFPQRLPKGEMCRCHVVYTFHYIKMNMFCAHVRKKNVSQMRYIHLLSSQEDLEARGGEVQEHAYILHRDVTGMVRENPTTWKQLLCINCENRPLGETFSAYI